MPLGLLISPGGFDLSSKRLTACVLRFLGKKGGKDPKELGFEYWKARLFRLIRQSLGEEENVNNQVDMDTHS